MYDYTKIDKKIKLYGEEENVLLRNINYFSVDKNTRAKFFTRLIDVKCYKKELLNKKRFLKELERCMKK